MNCFDGRKRTIMYFGNTSTTVLLPWYNEIKKSLEQDGYSITHLAYGTEKNPFAEIRTARRVEKRYIGALEKNSKDAKGLEVFYIDNSVVHLANHYLLSMALLVNNSMDYCASVSIDYSMLSKIEIEKYRLITIKYIEWKKEVVFDCGKHDIPFNYSIRQNPKVFDEIKIISENYNNIE